MSARVISFGDYVSKQAEYALLETVVPGHETQTVGVLLLDNQTDTLHVRLRRDWDSIATEEDAEVLAELESDLELKAREFGAAGLLALLEESSSLALRVSEREAVAVRNFDRTLSDLYRKYVHAKVLAFRTHLPRYSLSVAAGPFLSNREDIAADEWVEVPSTLRLEDDMFIAEIRGKSMEPRIPDGSLCVFRRGVVGSRTGRLVLVRNSELADDNQYTVKRYKSFKTVSEDGYAQNRIRLESLNPDYPSWDLDQDADKYEVMAEFVCVLD